MVTKASLRMACPALERERRPVARGLPTRAIAERGGSQCEDSEVRVITSGRRVSRAPMGFAAALIALDSSPVGSMLFEGGRA
jgi:hypothetical protein